MGLRTGVRNGHLLRPIGHGPTRAHHVGVRRKPHALHITVTHHRGLLSHHGPTGWDGLESIPTPTHAWVPTHLRGEPHVARGPTWGPWAHGIWTHLTHHVIHILVL